MLQDTVSKLQNALIQLRDKQGNASDQAKRSLDAAEHAHYEKNAADMEIRRLKDELERQHVKLRDSITDQVNKSSKPSLFSFLYLVSFRAAAFQTNAPPLSEDTPSK